MGLSLVSRGTVGRRNRSTIARFWSKVDRSSGRVGCWWWTGTVISKGYGWFHHSPARGRVYAHRFSWELAHGKLSDGMAVCHSCDNPRCVNPAHLWLGTIADNNRDKLDKGRSNMRRGSENANAILTEQLVLEIRSRSAAGESQRKLAASYGVTRAAIRYVVSGGGWAHVT